MKSKKDKKPPLIILTAGGTGGHVFPAQSLAEELIGLGYKIMFVTDTRGLRTISGALKQNPHKTVCSNAIMGRSFFNKILSFFQIIYGITQSLYIIIRNRPACVVGFGGYAAFPCCVASILLGTDLIIHEQNSVMSRVNRLLCPYATTITTSFKKTKFVPNRQKTALVGMPIRSSIVELFGHEYNFDKDKKTFNILVIGGSQGASIFSQVLPSAIGKLDKKIQQKITITQQARKDDINQIEQAYQNTHCQYNISSFFDDMASLYKKADLIISRSGASSITEIAVAGIPSILVPLPTSADNHQLYNAQAITNSKAGIIIEQKDFTQQKLSETLVSFIKKPQILSHMAKNTQKVAITDATIRLAKQVKKTIINKK